MCVRERQRNERVCVRERPKNKRQRNERVCVRERPKKKGVRERQRNI